MCGVFGVAPSSEDKLIERYNIKKHPQSLGGLLGYKKLPTDLIATISDGQIIPRKWWFVPAWASNPEERRFAAFNIRAETVAEKMAYKDAWEKGQRCIIPASFFIEWRKEFDLEKSKEFKQPCLIRPKDDEFFSLAGIYETWIGRGGEKMETCSIITTEPNDLIKKVHNRMPVIIDREDEKKWLSRGSDRLEIVKLMVPRPERFMEMYEISREYGRKKSEEITEGELTKIS